MNAIERQRMETMISQLRRLPPEKFDFSFVVKHGTPRCGTIGCAMGWSPAFFPELVEWNGKDDCAWGQAGLSINGEALNYGKAAVRLFGLEEQMALNLFSPAEGTYDDEDELESNKIHESLPSLGEDATPIQVADMLQEFLALVDIGDIHIPTE